MEFSIKGLFLKVIIAFLTLLIWTSISLLEPVYGQADASQLELNENRWEELKKEINYEAPERKESEPSRSNNSGFFSFISTLGPFIKIIIIGALVFVVIFVVLKLVGNDSAGDKRLKSQNKMSIREMEENLHEADLDKFLKEALEQKEFKKAVRIYYLMVIKLLSEKNWIHWKKEKTNGQYLYEMTDNPHYKEFNSLTILFERIWFSDQFTDENIQPRHIEGFKSFIQQINQMRSEG
jgi:predicted Holliday junction resolvase-like endonuclease